jgi:hypothetical protein
MQPDMNAVGVLAIFIILFQSSPPDWGKQQEPTDKKQDISKSAQPSISVSTVVNKNPTEEESVSPTEQRKDCPDKSFVGDLPTWGLFLVGFFGAWIANKTLGDIKRQTNALISGNRSWVTADVERVPGFGGIMNGSGHEMGVGPLRTESTAFRARIICRNDGKTPAWITKKQAGLDIVETLPEVPDWTRTTIIQVAPEQLLVGQVGKPTDETLYSKRGRALGKMTILYGLVTYRDPFGENKTTSFGYYVRDDGSLERIPNPKYNENA